MSDQQDSRPAKQRRIHGTPLLGQTSPGEDDEDSSSSSSSSSVQLPTTRLSHRPLKGTNLPLMESSSSDEEEIDDEDEDDNETTSSSDSDDSDSEEMSEEEEDEEEGEDVEDGQTARCAVPPSRESDLKSRLQSFLPQLQQANKELENSKEVADKRIDHVSDDAEHYIEMEVGLGVLSEQDDGATQIRLPHLPSSDEEDNAEDDEINDGQDGMGNSVLSRLLGANGTKGIKRKIEEL
ncbi:hypothetical protein AYL99_02000 [Fonsecaea erecta]|uniref:Uncharacterized protein n=1 Tax=Fonsecaea erecta TaxID=1367422 RepID=A0A178ZU81_9EURO|nr:hypothetical protein AYL99_02000 [Fonsecaea erecta]OAP62773.1 hypothetical protein AYL99_02000 [Fonsecaea erecta]